MGWGRGEGRGVEERGREGGRQAVTERSDVTACIFQTFTFMATVIILYYEAP